MLLRNRVAGQSSRGLIDWPYPFVEGELFALTISSGLEGYHVQVDGRHVASFPYRVVSNVSFCNCPTMCASILPSWKLCTSLLWLGCRLASQLI